MTDRNKHKKRPQEEGSFGQKRMSRRQSIQKMAGGILTGAAALHTSCSVFSSKKEKEAAALAWKEYFKKNYRLMTREEREQTVARLTKQYELQTGDPIHMSSQDALPGVLYGYAFNISKCKGYLDCIKGCVEENNQDRASEMQYIRIHEHKKGSALFHHSNSDFFHQVPKDDHFYIGSQCFHCDNPPCTKACPVEATWKEKDGLVVVDYDWCIGCRYCMAACPYDGRRFNWRTPKIAKEEVIRTQHYLGNRLRKKGVMEKCTFCIQRSREGKNPACVEACTTGARVFGNLLDKDSEIRWILKNKKVFRLKEDLGTEPKFWFYMD